MRQRLSFGLLRSRRTRACCSFIPPPPLLPSTNGEFTLTVLTGAAADNSADIEITIVDDVGSTTSTNITVHVINDGGQTISATCPETSLKALEQVGGQVGKAAGEVTVVDLLMLSSLWLNDVDLTNCCVWQYLSNLKTLDLVGSSISNLACLGTVQKLSVLRLNNTRVSDLSPIAGLTNLTEFDLNANPGGSVDGVLASLPQLNSLALSGDMLTNVCSLQNLVGLTSLKLYGNRLTDVSCLQTLTNLTVLDLHQNLLTNVMFLTNLPWLSTVDLRYNLLDTNSSAVMGVIGSLTNRGAVVEYMPQRAAPMIFILTNYIVAAGWANKLGYYITENGQPSGDGIQMTWSSDNPDLVSNSNIWMDYTNTSPAWLEWYVHVTPAANQSGLAMIALFTTNDAGLGSSNSTLLSVTPPLSVTNQVFGSSNLYWRTSPEAPWFGQTVMTRGGEPAAQSGSIGSTETSWLEADVVGPGLLTFWWRVSSETNSDLLECFSLPQANSISGEAGWRQEGVSILPGTNTLRWQYSKTNDRYSTGLDAGWVSDVLFFPLAPVVQTTSGGFMLSWPGSGAFRAATTFGGPWFQMATNVSGPWTDYMSATNSPLLISPSNLIPAQFFRLRL